MPEVTCTLDSTSRVATLVIDTAGPINTIGTTLVADLERAWARAVRGGARGVLVRSGKKRSFLDGANLAELLKLDPEWELKPLLRRFQTLLAEMAASEVPVLGVVEGATALGGGFELLLWACDHVLATPGARLGLPEVNVGVFPAAGGAQTLPRAIPFKEALDVVTGGRVLPAEEYVRHGLVTMSTPAGIGADALAWLDAHPTSHNRNVGGEVFPGDIGAEEKRPLLAAARTRFCVCAEKPWFPALLDAMEGGLGRPVPEAAAAEIDLFVPLLSHANARNTIDFFFLNASVAPKLARVRDERARAVPRLAIIGAGLMGQGIAQVAADRGIEALLLDVDEARVAAAIHEIDETVSTLVARGKWTQERRDTLLARITGCVDYGSLAGFPLVIEAVFEDLDLKRRILARVQEVDPEIVFASNTSTLPMADIAAASRRPEQVVGMHFFSPVPLMALLEVVEGKASSEEAVATAVTLGRRLGKTCILVGDGPGFYTSRTFGTFVLGGFHLAEAGMHPRQVDRIALAAGFPQGPLHVYGTAGGTVIRHAASVMASRLPFHVIPPTLDALFEAGYVGAGRPCFYRDAKGLDFDESVLPLIIRRDGPVPSDEEARDVLLLGMCNEALRCLADGVLRDIASMELGAVLGIGFPGCWHGPARYLSLRGVRACRDRLAELHARFRIAQLAPCAELDRLTACGVDTGLA